MSGSGKGVCAREEIGQPPTLMLTRRAEAMR